MQDWMMQLDGQLSGLKADGVMTSTMIWREADQVNPGVSRPTVQRWIKKATDAGKLTYVSRGTYLNNQALPRPDFAEAAQFVRQGAIVSLQTVLSDIGALNNPYPVITALLPLSQFVSPKLGRTRLVNQSFHFYGMPVGLLNTGTETDGLDGTARYPRATPERALLDWLYLARSSKSSFSAPPMDIDLSWIHQSRFNRLLKAMDTRAPGIKQYWETWNSRWKQYSRDGIG